MLLSCGLIMADFTHICQGYLLAILQFLSISEATLKNVDK